ncbi:MAG: putative RNA methyltransferase [Dermatophilaceae bacterium]
MAGATSEVSVRAAEIIVFACPVCQGPLPRATGGYRCANGHQFDGAREGYVNLLLAHLRNSKDPGYTTEMIAARRDFFDAGYYEKLADRVAELVTFYLPETGERLVVDAGCGEGYYLRRLRSHLLDRHQTAVRCGMDISKHGIRVAARRDPEGMYAVAGTYRMPLLPRRANVLLTQFSPVSAADFRRVVRPGGVVLVGGPGEDHLFSVKELLYDAPTRHQPQATLADELGFEVIAAHRIRYPLALRGPGHVAKLLTMTPFFWSVPPETQARLAAMGQLDTEVDVIVHAYRRTEDAQAYE